MTLTFVSFVVSILKKLKERMLPVSVGIQDIKISLLSVMVIMNSNVKEEVELFVFILLRISSIQNINSQLKKDVCV